MLLKSIKLINFRQFINSEINFSTDKKKNVTLIIADNRVGKTTIANAFTWCLFGQTNFHDQIILNRKIANKMKIWATEDVVVEVQLRYGRFDYTIKTKQTYQLKDRPIGLASTEFSRIITYKDTDTGLTKPIEEKDVSDLINFLIPHDLSNYFFIKAEQINSMGNNIEHRLNNSDFSTAVKKILGMQALENAIKHLKDQQGSVYDLFQGKYKSNSNEKILWEGRHKNRFVGGELWRQPRPKISISARFAPGKFAYWSPCSLLLQV